MLKNYLKIAFRSLWRNRGYSLINILGLAVGIAACLLIFLVVNFESSFDRFHTKYERIYRIAKMSKYANGNIDRTPGSPKPLAKALRLDMPQLEKVVSVFGTIDPQMTILGKNPNYVGEAKKFREEGEGLFVEPEFFDIFDFAWQAGSPAVLKDPFVVVLSQKIAEKYFGSWQNAMGQYLKMDNKITLQVKGILKNPPSNSDFPMQIIGSYATYLKYPEIYPEFKNMFNLNNWGSTSSNDQVFVLFPKDLSKAKADQLIDKFSKKHYGKRKDNSVNSHYFNPLREIHFDPDLSNFKDRTMAKSTLWTLSLIGILILVMASINYINLATAQAVSRSKEVGIRKLLGGFRQQLLWQFMGETLVIVSISVLIAINLSELALPFMNQVSNLPPDINLITNPMIWAFAGLVIGLVSLLSGIYPALILSGFQPAQALKNKITVQNIGGVSLKRGLVVLQFSIAQILIISTLIAMQQMQFIRNLDMGFNKEGVYIVPIDNDTPSRLKLKALKNELLQNPNIQAVSYANDPPSSDNTWSSNFAYDRRGKDADFNSSMKIADADYFKTYGLEFVAGKGYAPSDTGSALVVNETLLRKLGIKNPQEAVGKSIRIGGKDWLPISGVVKDFQRGSVRDAMEAICIFPTENYYYRAGIKLSGKNLVETVANIRQTFEKAFPEKVFEGYFLDESIANFYAQEVRLTTTYQIFAGLAIFISCLGLYGLISFLALQKTKEIGIRKVLGASVMSIVGLLTKDFLRLVLISGLIAAPVAYYFMSQWLQNFVYRIKLNGFVFVLATLTIMIIAVLTIAYRAFRAGFANPVEALRHE
ncbi:MAG: ABC transporter permease [Microscillaceae bacterium]|jgi:predicted permease|nr:ABC transporter permease [Microscillaceae bacterium]